MLKMTTIARPGGDGPFFRLIDLSTPDSKPAGEEEKNSNEWVKGWKSHDLHTTRTLSKPAVLGAPYKLG